ncbi:RNA polymerase sigma factor [Hyphomicrobiales bacterium 4NK60-0047b]
MQSGIIETEQDLIIHAQKGDQKAFKELVHQNLPNVLALGFRMLNNASEAEDMAQDVMLSLWQNISKYDAGKAKFSTWLYRITANRCLDRIRKKTPEQLPEDYDPVIEAEQLDNLYNKQLSKQMETTLQTLPERQYLALVLFHYQGHRMTEVAEIMECSSEAVESLLARARRTLKQKLGPLWQEFQNNSSPNQQEQNRGEVV